jgi:transcriptional regulator with XRE-family HTH domain
MTKDQLPVSEFADQASYFGGRVRTFRKARGWSQEELAQVLANFHKVVLHQTTVAKLESGTRPTNVPEIFALASALGVSYDELLPLPVAANTSGDITAAKIAFERVRSMAKARAKEADRARDQAVQIQHEAAALDKEVKALEHAYHAALRTDAVQRRRAEKHREIAAEVE